MDRTPCPSTSPARPSHLHVLGLRSVEAGRAEPVLVAACLVVVTASMARLPTVDAAVGRTESFVQVSGGWMGKTKPSAALAEEMGGPMASGAPEGLVEVGPRAVRGADMGGTDGGSGDD
jgi:hypothetical protein